MADDKIWAANDKTDHVGGTITGTDSGTKRALDVVSESRALDFAVDDASATVTIGRYCDSDANFDNVWDEPTADHTTASTFGFLQKLLTVTKFLGLK